MAKIIVGSRTGETGNEHGRAEAVTAALNLLQARATSASPMDLEFEIGSLGKYADQIQAALQTK